MTNEAKLIEFFNVALKGNDVNYNQLIEAAIKVGYIVAPECSTHAVYEFIKAQEINPNATFYKDWVDVTSKSRLELFIDQIRHYASTYGTGFTEGNGYVPNDGDIKLPELTKYKFIGAVDHKEMFDRCMSPLQSGIALSSDTVKVLTEFICETSSEYSFEVDVDSIKNREAQVIICDELGIAPVGCFDLLRYIVYKTTGETMIIQNKHMIDLIKSARVKFNFNRLNEAQLRSLASIFFRYKNIILAFKHDSNGYSYYGRVTHHDNNHNARVINKLRRMANKYHKPLQANMWSNVLSGMYSIDEINAHISELNNYKLVGLMQTISERFNNAHGALYIVRNGKIFINSDGADFYKREDNLKRNGEFWMELYTLFYNELISRLKTKACVVKFSKDVHLKFPATEKTFFGNIPFGTEYELAGGNFVGIYWRGEWGTQDFDIHYYDNNSNHIGWCSSFYNNSNSVVFSGDRTSAYPDAAEVMYIKNSAPDGVISVSRYRGAQNSKYQLFFGRDKNFTGFTNQGYMVNPDHIEGKAEIVNTSKSQMAAVVKDGRLIMSTFDINNRIVVGNSTLRNELIQAKISSYVPVEQVLLAAGFTDYDKLNPEVEADKLLLDQIAKGEVKILDLTELNRDTIINLMK